MNSKKQVNKRSETRQVGLKVLGNSELDLSKAEKEEDINQNIQNTFKDNPYQYTRGIRFKLTPERQSKEFQAKYQFDNQEQELFKAVDSSQQNKQSTGQRLESERDRLSELSNLLLSFHSDIKSLLYTYSKNSDPTFRKKLSVNKTWLNHWHKQTFYNQIKKDNNKDGKYALSDLKVLHQDFLSWLNIWKEHSSELERASKEPKYSQFRHSEIAHNVRGLLNRRQWDYINEFLEEIYTTDKWWTDEKIKCLKDNLQKIHSKLKEAGRYYLPSQSSGIEITKASFNYYTVDKKGKKYYENEIENAKNKLHNPSFSIIRKTKSGKYQWIINRDQFKRKGANNHSQSSMGNKHFQKGNRQQSEIFCFNSDQEEKWLKRYCKNHKYTGDLETELSLSLDQTYSAIKSFKAEQKSIFYEVIAHIASKEERSYEVKNKNHFLKGYEFSYKKFDFENIKSEFSLFIFKDRKLFDKFKDLTKKLSSEQVPSKKIAIAQKRGRLLLGKFCKFDGYKDLCEEYKKIAQQRGRLMAQDKGVDKERLEVVQTDFWSLIYCDQDKKQLWLVPKEKRKEAKRFIDNRQGYSQEDSRYLCCFESLTMRALHKLCFAEQSTFVKDMPINIKQLQKDAKEFDTQGDEKKLLEKDQRKLKFFKVLLKSDYAREKLLLNNFDLQWIDGSKDLDIFEKSLEKACYYVKRVILKEEKKDSFLKEFDITVLNISSYDLEGRNKKNQPGSENRYHTDLWKAFWDNIDEPKKEVEVKGFSVGLVRLNPEVKIYYREEDKDLKNYLKKRGFPVDNDKFKHRKLQDQFTAHFTLALNAGKRYEDLAFAKTEDMFDKINDFNDKLNSEMKFETDWKYGIDRGQKELATLCLVKFDYDKEVYKINDRKIVKPEFAGFKCYTLKDYNLKGCIQCGALKEEGHSERCNKKKDQSEEWRPVIKNLSYFIYEKHFNDIFKKETTSSIDLTTAKVINGKIITNGDVMTYLNLKKAIAKRRLYELYHSGRVKQPVTFSWNSKDELKVQILFSEQTSENQKQSKENSPEEKIYKYAKKYEGILINKDKNDRYNRYNPKYIENSLRHYLKEIQSVAKEKSNHISKEKQKPDSNHTPSIQKINHLRDAITANMVGVICHLQKTHKGFVVLEDLEKETIEEHFFNYNANISRRLENALYNKFQSLGLVPPHVKDIIRLRENIRERQKEEAVKFSSSQIGAIVFVDKENTSRNCPYCEKTQTKALWNETIKEPSDREKTADKWRKRKGKNRFFCKACGFDTYLFKPETEREAKNTNPDETKKEQFNSLKNLNDPDKVAAYNIAKKIKKAEDIGKWKK